MQVTLYKNGKAWKKFTCEEIDIVTGDNVNEGALFFFKENDLENGIVIDAEITMSAEFGENQITLIQAVSQ